MMKPARRFGEIRRNATMRGFRWELTFSDYVDLFWGADCMYCGEVSGGGIDRLNNEPFYSIANTVACCGACNKMKSDITLHEFIAAVERVAHNLFGVTANAAIACEGK